MGELQQKHAGQLTEVKSVQTCNADTDSDRELCVRYGADPLGSLREEPYEATTVVELGLKPTLRAQ